MSRAGTDALDARELAGLLDGTRFAEDVRVVEVVDSTVDVCRRSADDGAAEGLVVLADRQRRGRGQRGVSWFSPASGGLYLSTLLRPMLPPHEAQLLTVAAGLAACRAVREHFGVEAWVKLPNDLLVKTAGAVPGWRKLGGVLVDAAVQGTHLRHAVVSLGVNVGGARDDFPAELRAVVTTLADELPRPPRRIDVAASFLVRLEALLAELEATGAASWLAAASAARAALTAHAPGFAMPVFREDPT